MLKLIRFVCLCLAGVWETAVSMFSLRLDVRHNASHIQLSLGGRRRGGGSGKGGGGGGAKLFKPIRLVRLCLAGVWEGRSSRGANKHPFSRERKAC